MGGEQGSQLLHAAIYANDADIAKFYIQEGADVHNPPRKVHPFPQDKDNSLAETYRRSPFLIQVACSSENNNLEMFMEF